LQVGYEGRPGEFGALSRRVPEKGFGRRPQVTGYRMKRIDYDTSRIHPRGRFIVDMM
jgi:hypothetical protein